MADAAPKAITNAMKLARYAFDGATRIGVVSGDRVIALSRLGPDAPASIRELLAAGPALLRRIANALAQPAPPQPGHASAEVRLLAPIPDRQEYLAP